MKALKGAFRAFTISQNIQPLVCKKINDSPKRRHEQKHGGGRNGEEGLRALISGCGRGGGTNAGSPYAAYWKMAKIALNLLYTYKPMIYGFPTDRNSRADYRDDP
jgi:hypothetical protein